MDKQKRNFIIGIVLSWIVIVVVVDYTIDYIATTMLNATSNVTLLLRLVANVGIFFAYVVMYFLTRKFASSHSR